MKILELNNTDMGSTGNIMLNIAKVARDQGHEVMTASKLTKTSLDLHRNDPNHIYIGDRVGNTIHRYWAWMTDLQDTGSVFSTFKFLEKVRHFKPDIIHLHDVLGWYLNIDILFNWLKEYDVPVVWTFHDCWAFTGRCIYFDDLNCDLWKTGCGKCPTTRVMPHSWWFDLSAWNWKRKRKLFTSLRNLTIVTPSQWLADLTKESFLSNAEIKVINNGINLSVFRPSKGHIYDELKSDGKKIILGVAGTWSKRKGLDDIIKISKDISSNSKIVLVGLNPEEVNGVDNVTAIKRTNNQSELAQIYSAADVFINPTYEDNFPTVNLESMACGTPVITYKTGGSPESVGEGCGLIIEKGDTNALLDSITTITNKDKAVLEHACINRSKLYDMNDRFDDYIRVFESLKQ